MSAAGFIDGHKCFKVPLDYIYFESLTFYKIIRFSKYLKTNTTEIQIFTFKS